MYNKVRTKPDPTVKELTEALKHEKNPISRKAPEPSFNPSVSGLQHELQMPRVVLEHLAGRAAATAGVPGEMSTEGLSSLNQDRFEDLFLAAGILAPPSNSEGWSFSRRRNRAGLTLLEGLRSWKPAKLWAQDVAFLLEDEQKQ